jgi:hypothetical protein
MFQWSYMSDNPSINLKSRVLKVNNGADNSNAVAAIIASGSEAHDSLRTVQSVPLIVQKCPAKCGAGEKQRGSSEFVVTPTCSKRRNIIPLL